jgi:hypothetical protein
VLYPSFLKRTEWHDEGKVLALMAKQNQCIAGGGNVSVVYASKMECSFMEVNGIVFLITHTDLLNNADSPRILCSIAHLIHGCDMVGLASNLWDIEQ